MRIVEKPVSARNPNTPHDDNITTTHPAFGQIAIHKIQGRQVCYGSDFVHQQCVQITVEESEHNRNLSHDWYFPKKTIVELRMSEAQWAAFVSSFNMGTGIPCTLTYVRDRGDEAYVPGLPDPDVRREYSKEVAETMKDSIKSLVELRGAIERAGLSKKKENELLSHLNHSLMEIQSNVPFVQKSFDKHVENSVERAKVEVHAYLNNAMTSAGLKALTQEQEETLALPNSNELK